MNSGNSQNHAQTGAVGGAEKRSGGFRRLARVAPVVLFALGLALPVGVAADNAEPGQNTAGSDLRKQLQKSFDEIGKALEQKRAAGTITEEEREILNGLTEARTSLDETDAADLEAIAALASGKGIEVVPDAKSQAAGVKPFTFTAADLAKAQKDAIKMSSAAEAFANSESGRALEAAARQDDSGGSRSGGSGNVWASKDGGNGRKVTAAAATEDGVLAFSALENADAQTNSLDAVDFGILNWDFGEFHPRDNCARTEVEISGLKVDRNGLGFRYLRDLSSWGLGHDEAEALACLFVCDGDGRWVGGKFDWISSSRDRRDFENVYGGYGGWNLSRIPNPCPVAFVIVSKDGSKRSNIISGVWER